MARPNPRKRYAYPKGKGIKVTITVHPVLERKWTELAREAETTKRGLFMDWLDSQTTDADWVKMGLDHRAGKPSIPEKNH